MMKGVLCRGLIVAVVPTREPHMLAGHYVFANSFAHIFICLKKLVSRLIFVEPGFTDGTDE
jgi:hypothetical protein